MGRKLALAALQLTAHCTAPAHMHSLSHSLTHPPSLSSTGGDDDLRNASPTSLATVCGSEGVALADQHVVAKRGAMTWDIVRAIFALN
jgi:hypothetical protein